MKKRKYLIGLLLAVIVTTGFSFPKPRFFIITHTTGDLDPKRAITYSNYFESQVIKSLWKNFPCVELNSESGVKALISLDRDRHLLGSGDDNALQNIAGAMGCDYLVGLSVNETSGTAVINAVCLNSRKPEAIARAFKTAPAGEAVLDAIEQVTQDLVDGISQYEICPFTGDVKVKVINHLEKDEEEEYSVFCNNKDETYHKETTTRNHSEMEWRLEKTWLKAASGTVNYNISEEFSLVEENGCFKCKSGREGGRTLRESISTKGKIEGLSNESTQNGLPVDDARISLKFMDDGTYTLVVKAASKKGNLTLIKETHSEGTCDPVNEVAKPIQKNADIGIRDLTFGPFNGTAKEKSLSNQQVINRTDPNSEEENQYSIEFNLKRD